MSRIIAMLFVLASVASATAQDFHLLTGVDVGRFPGTGRPRAPSPGPGFPGTFQDGDRLAGSADTGAAVVWNGSGTPIISPNQFGSLSFLYRRGSVPIPAPGNPVVPILGIEFLGGPLLDLDGDLGNGSRRLTPQAGQTPIQIPGSTSIVSLSLDRGGGMVTLTGFDATGTNEGASGLSPANGVTVNTLAGTTPFGGQTGPINPGIDDRTGTLTSYAGTGGTLTGVYRIGDLGFELWQDSIDPASSTAGTLGTFQYLGALRGWYVERDGSGQFPTLAGQGLGGTLWPLVDTSQVGAVVNTTLPAFPTATIAGGVPQDHFAAAGNGGLPLSGFGGDLGAYLDAVVVPLIDPLSQRFVFLEAAGFGVNNSFDPVFGDTVGYDVVLIGQSTPIPEPGTAALLVAAGIPAVCRRRNRCRGVPSTRR